MRRPLGPVPVAGGVRVALSGVKIRTARSSAGDVSRLSAPVTSQSPPPLIHAKDE